MFWSAPGYARAGQPAGLGPATGRPTIVPPLVVAACIPALGSRPIHDPDREPYRHVGKLRLAAFELNELNRLCFEHGVSRALVFRSGPAPGRSWPARWQDAPVPVRRQPGPARNRPAGRPAPGHRQAGLVADSRSIAGENVAFHSRWCALRETFLSAATRNGLRGYLVVR